MLELRDGVGGYQGFADTTLSRIDWAWAPESHGNFGAMPQLRMFGKGTRRALIRFDLAAVPADAEVVEATLTLHVESIASADRPRADLFAVTESWIEGTCPSQYFCDPDGATWSERGPGLGPWSRPGGTHGDRVSTAPLAAGRSVRFDITAVVADWVAGRQPNHGLLVRGRGTWRNDVAFASSDHPDPARRPSVRIVLRAARPDARCAGADHLPEETCDGRDDDCDGEVDEGFDVGAACVAGVGACATVGARICEPDGRGTRCDAAPGAPVAEICNGVDDDCDGEIDEPFALGEACAAGVGACRRLGTTVCGPDGGLTCDAAPGAPVAERRDGADNDCDGETDEGIPAPGRRATVVLHRTREHDDGWSDTTVSRFAWTAEPESEGNFGGAPFLRLYADGVRQALVRFDVTRALPADARIIDAWLRLYVHRIKFPSAAGAELYAVTESWVEGTCPSQYGCEPDGATWFDRGPGLPPWSEAGGTRAERVAAAPLRAGRFVEFDVTDIVAAWAGGRVANHGLLIRGRVPWANDVLLASSEHPDPGLRPTLKIAYTVGDCDPDDRHPECHRDDDDDDRRRREPDDRALAGRNAPEEPLTAGDEYDEPSGSAVCERVLRADVVALDQAIFFNRFGVFLPSGMMYALRRDVVPIDGETVAPGNVTLRPDKRPRPLVLRMNAGDCLEVKFTNLLAPARVDEGQPATRAASMMVNGLSLVGSIASAGSNVGANPNSLAEPGETRIYRWYASREGTFVIRSAGALAGGEGDGGQAAHGLFGAVNVEPRGSVWYRSQVTAEELDHATVDIDAAGNRRLDYDAVYPPGHRWEGRPVLRILDGDEIFHSDLNAIIADIPSGTYPPVTAAAPPNGEVERHRDEPFREFTVIYHDEQALIQGFDIIEEDDATFHSVRDNMAINYGTASVGTAILSIGPAFGEFRRAVGPAADCNDCKYEEFFLSSWPLGDPAMILERAPAPPGAPHAAGEAVRALYPDDPSNVHHSYLNDHVKMRVLHGGVKEHHIHHVHGHQWLHEANSDESTYYDSQALGPGTGLTIDMAYNGAGNRNKTPGDAIFHCHFYPHFAQGMWELWRVHDVFEDGTRTLPDPELPEGSPIPAVVPLPGLAMAPPPSPEMPGYPFYIPGVPGHRAPHPPLDTAFDGGLPRHVVRGGDVESGRRGPFDRIHTAMDAVALPEEGTELERAAMAFHAEREHPSVTPEGEPAVFVTNGRPPAPGAPYADPCVDDDGRPAGALRVIKAAAIQIDAIINRAGWHFPQTRMFAHWADVEDFVSGERPPEPFFMRAHSGDCIEYHLANLIPNVYAADDFQVFTPTDVIGQHIHLVKFDVTSSDGAANGWNYEDGSFSPDEVIERIAAINAMGGLDLGDGTRRLLEAEPHPFFGVPGAQTTIQRWWADPLLDARGEDRTIRTVFTHDHFSPSTHQQAGLYAGLLVEPAGSTWRDPETGEQFGTRFDGGPTSWRADIITADPAESFREFNIEFQDFALAYTAANEPVNPPGRREVPLPHLVEPPPEPMPEAVSADDPGTFTMNYRNEPLALRLRDPETNAQAAGVAGDPALAFSSHVRRADPAFNRQPDFYPPLTADVGPLDPFTPMLRAYEGDRVQIRMLIGAHEEGHNGSIHGMRWLHEPGEPYSGYRNFQMSGISEHFEFETPQLTAVPDAWSADYLYSPDISADGLWNGLWGLLRVYSEVRPDLLPLPNNPDADVGSYETTNFLDDEWICPRDAPVRRYDVTAVRAADALPGGTLVYNRGHGLHDPTALLYVRTEDLDDEGRLRAGAPVEPLILRANAGDCIEVTLRNGFRHDPLDVPGFNMWPPIVDRFNANQVRPSSLVGLHPQLVHYDVRRHNGIQVGHNDPWTVAEPGTHVTYRWYAGRIEHTGEGRVTATPVEFGAVNLMPADPLKHTNKGLVGALIIEPEDATWIFPQRGTRAVADVEHPDGRFREFVIITQDDVNLLHPPAPGDAEFPLGRPVPPVAGGTVEAPGVEDAEDSGNKAINYRTEPLWTRVGYAPGAPLTGGHAAEPGAEPGDTATNEFDFADGLSIAGSGPVETPIFRAPAGTPVRFRLLQAGGHPRNHVFELQGHVWRHEPGNELGELIGAQQGHGPAAHWNIVPLHGAGGAFGVPGDYLYRSAASFPFSAGLWGVFRVTPPAEER